MLIEMKVTGLTIDPMTEMPILILKDSEEKHALPIWIGLVEAGAIASELEQIDLARPMTHDLLKTILDDLGAQVVHVEITDLRENTYYATLVLKHGARVFEVDARPSDAIALALRAECPIRVNEDVIEKAREIDLGTSRSLTRRGECEPTSEALAAMRDEEFGKWKM